MPATHERRGKTRGSIIVENTQVRSFPTSRPFVHATELRIQTMHSDEARVSSFAIVRVEFVIVQDLVQIPGLNSLSLRPDVPRGVTIRYGHQWASACCPAGLPAAIYHAYKKNTMDNN